MTSPAIRLETLGISLPAVSQPVANFLPYVQDGNMLYLSGQGPRKSDGTYHQGKVGADVGLEDAYDHARLTGINLLAVLHSAIGGDWSRVQRIVKLFGMVNATPDFQSQPKVINGCSDLLVAVFGDAGRHARSAVGMGSLPGGMTVEIEMIVALKQD
ncbi:RidA family protein [Alcaligenaceae bacterium]|nr:RidA family protein [Alcaligenaceae bacterium]